ncbi:hypothetical protein ACHAWF_004070 [Thalassiosira exigua]
MAIPHVVFIHLDLGIGGAESLVLNLAKATLPRDFGTEGNDNQFEEDESPNRADALPQAQSGRVSLYTTHCSPTHCYDEVKPPDGPLSSYVHVRGSWIPRKLYVGGTAFCSALRMLYLTHRAVKENPLADVFVIDVLPTGVPYLSEYCHVNAGILFYCHFPDKLLTRDTVNGEAGDNENKNRSGLFMQLKTLYRWVLDTAEEWTMSYSDLVVVNSKFTRGEVEKVFPSLFHSQNSERTIEHATDVDVSSEERGDEERVKVLYPAIESSLAKQRRDSSKVAATPTTNAQPTGPIVSLNRFERKKNIALLLHAYDLLLERSFNEVVANLPPLVIAGGYDPLNVENVEHLAELRILADEILGRHGLPLSTVCSPTKSSPNGGELEGMIGSTSSNRYTNSQLHNASITFHPSISNAKRTKLLSCASMWCYTPHREHFGIVPLEAMDAGVPVVAIRSGGPMETVVDGETGYLVDYSPPNRDSAATSAGENLTAKGFADAIQKLLSDPSQSQAMGQRGRERVDELFGMETFRKQWWELLREARKRGLERHVRARTSYPILGWSLMRYMGEMLWALFFAVLASWTLKWSGVLVK